MSVLTGGAVQCNNLFK